MRTIADDVDLLAERIKELVAQGDEAREKADQFYIAAGIHLKELKERKPAGSTWADYARRVTGLGPSRVHELISIADGRTTVAETRARKADSMRRSREAAEASPPRGGENLNESEPGEGDEEYPEPSDEETLEQAFLLRAGEALRYAVYEGPKTKRALRAARQTAQAWMNLANQLQGD